MTSGPDFAKAVVAVPMGHDDPRCCDLAVTRVGAAEAARRRQYRGARRGRLDVPRPDARRNVRYRLTGGAVPTELRHIRGRTGTGCGRVWVGVPDGARLDVADG